MKIRLLFLLIFINFCTFAQINVRSFKLLETDMDARVNGPKEDQNGEKCAIIKVVTTESGFNWDGGSLGIVAAVKKTGEYWVYVPRGAKKITISHEKLGVLREYAYPVAIQSASVYELVLTTAKVKTVIEEQEIVTVWLVINSTPEGADIYIDDQNSGQTPFARELTEGKHTYRIEKDLYHVEAGVVQLSANEGKKTLNINMKPNYGYAIIKSTPESGANIMIDGIEQNNITPWKTNMLKSGTHTVTLTKNLYKQANQQFTIVDGQTVDVTVNMNPNFGGLTITTNPETGADITLDGQPTGNKTPFTYKKLATGNHTVTARLQWYEPKTEKFAIADGENKTITLQMIPNFSEVNITTNPTADIYIDATKVATGNYTGRVLAGLHTFEAKKDKHDNDLQKIEIVKGIKKDITLSPLPKYGTLRIITNPMDALISIDGKDYGTSPNTIKNLLVGSYTLTLSKTSFGSVSKTITITQNQITDINETLSGHVHFMGIKQKVYAA